MTWLKLVVFNADDMHVLLYELPDAEATPAKRRKEDAVNFTTTIR